MRRAAVLLAAALLFLAPACSRAEPTRASPADSIAARAAGWLWARQGADGGWHSATYGFLKPGHALTGFALLALLDVPESIAPRPRDGVERALAFLRRATDDDPDGALGRSDPDLLEYPTYATAYALRVLARAGDDAKDRGRIARMARWLASHQYSEANGFARSDPAYGGFGFGGTYPRGAPGHMDLAHTRRVLEALADADALTAPVRERALVFLGRMQNLAPAGSGGPEAGAPPPAATDAALFDGGFWFSPVVLDANKSAPIGARFRSYATATCDGVLALLACGLADDDARVRAATAWLDGAKDGVGVAGIAPGAIPWSDALAHYHLAVRREVERRVGRADTWRAKAVASLRPRDDGSLGNPLPFMKEDDPILSTVLALVALAPERPAR